jgi:hypothetical protein
MIMPKERPREGLANGRDQTKKVHMGHQTKKVAEIKGREIAPMMAHVNSDLIS